MKILHLYWDLEIGGIQTLLVQLANSQCKDNDVSCLIISSKDESTAEKIDSKVRVIYLNKTKGFGVSSFIAYLKLNFFLFVHKFDIIHLHDPKLLKYIIPLIKGNFIGTYHRDKNFYNTSRFACVTSVSKHVHDCLKHSLNTDSVIIENGIAVEKYKTNVSKKNEVFKIVQIGRLEHVQKAQDISISVLKKLKDNGYNVSLDFIGSGPSLNYLKSLVNGLNLCSNVHFLGQQKQYYIYENLCNYDLLVQPSTFEAFGLTVVEAMAAKVPVVVTDIPAFKSITENGKYGEIFKNGNIDDFFCVVKKIIDQGFAKERIEAAYEHAQSNYCIESMNQQYMNVYTKCLENN